ADLLRRVLECAVAFITVKAIRPLQTADHEVEMAVIVEVAPRRARRHAHWFRQVACLGRHVGETALPIVLEQLARAVALRDEETHRAAVVEVAEDRPDLARLVDNAGVLRLDKAFWRVEDENTGAGAVEEIGPAVAVDVAHGQRVALHVAADAVGP